MPVEKIIKFRRNRTDSPLSSEVPRATRKPKSFSNYDAIDREGDPYGDVAALEDDSLDDTENNQIPEDVDIADDEFSMYPEYGAMDYESDAVGE